MRTLVWYTPLHAAAHLRLDKLLLAAGDLPGALAALEVTCRLNHGLGEAHFGRGRLLEAAGRLPEAVTAYYAVACSAGHGATPHRPRVGRPGWQPAGHSLADRQDPLDRGPQTGQYLPLGVDADGNPVYAVYSNVRGEFVVYLPNDVMGGVAVVAAPPDDPEPRLSYNTLVTKMETVKSRAEGEVTVQVDEANRSLRAWCEKGRRCAWSMA